MSGLLLNHKPRIHMEEQTQALLKTIRELSDIIEMDVPMQGRSRRFNNTLAYLMELAESVEEYPIRRNVNLEPLTPCTCETATI